MSSDRSIISFQNVSKKFCKKNTASRSLREDMAGLLGGRQNKAVLNADEFWALQNINFEVRPGQVIHLAGPNGSGKTTILKLIAGISDPTHGHIKVHGRVAPIIELGAGFHPDLSGQENIFVNGVILGMKIKEVKEKVRSIIEFSEIEEFIEMPVKYYSLGMWVRLAFAVAIHSEADIYLFDEVIAVGDAAFFEKCILKILELKQRNKTILFVSHNASVRERVPCDVINMAKGTMV